MAATTSPRTWAYAALGADEYLRAFPHEYSIQILKQTMAARIWRRYEINQSSDWHWFEQELAYVNARLNSIEESPRVGGIPIPAT